MAITWVPPLDMPVNVVPVLGAGGSLDANTTYYIRICAADYNNYRRTDPPLKRSAPSVEVNITTDAVNKTINLTWNAVAGAVVYNIYITDDPAGNDRWRALTMYYQKAFVNNYTITGITGWNHLLDTFAIPADAVTPANLDKELGDGYVNVIGAVGAIDFDDLAGVVPAGYIMWDGSNFILKGSVYFITATGSMNESYKRIQTWHGYFHPHSNSHASFLMTFTNCIMDCFHWSYRMVVGGMTLTRCLMIRGIAYGSYKNLYGADNYLNIESDFIDGGDNTVNGLNTQVHSNISLEDWKILVASILIKGNSNLTLLNCSCTAYMGLFYNSADFSTLNIRECSINETVAYDMRFAYNWTAATYPFYDCIFPLRADNIPVVGYTTAGAYDNTVELFNSFSIRVQTEAGVAIENATVTLKNKNDVQQFSVSTDIHGDIVKQDVSRLFITHTPGGGSTANDVEEYSPFTITIEKAGYWTYENVFDLSEKKDWTISLIPLSDFLAIPVEVSVETPEIEVIVETPAIDVTVDSSPQVDVQVDSPNINVQVEVPEITVEVSCET